MVPGKWSPVLSKRDEETFTFYFNAAMEEITEYEGLPRAWFLFLHIKKNVLKYMAVKIIFVPFHAWDKIIIF
jgi:hypothetical protein